MSKKPIDIKPEHLVIVQKILSEHLPKGSRVWVFGSRATGHTKKSSDLDLVIDICRPLTQKESLDLSDDFDESDLPYKVDFVDIYSMSDSFKALTQPNWVELNWLLLQPSAKN